LGRITSKILTLEENTGERRGSLIVVSRPGENSGRERLNAIVVGKSKVLSQRTARLEKSLKGRKVSLNFHSFGDLRCILLPHSMEGDRERATRVKSSMLLWRGMLTDLKTSLSILRE